MKVSRIEIKDFQQFKDFELDLTYPEGHPKAGQPLDKVCFIGQSGTGKTTILRLIDTLISETKNIYSFEEKNEVTKENLAVRLNYSSIKDNREGFCIKYRDFLDYETYYHEITRGNLDSIEELNHLLFFETGLENHTKLITGVNQYSLPPVHTQGDMNQIRQKQAEIISGYNEITCINSDSYFSDEAMQFYIFQKLYTHNELVKGVSNKLYNNALNGNIEKILLELKAWKEHNPNPRVELSKKLENILSKFNLKIDTESTQDYIKLKTLQDTEISIQAASTGTKQILLSAIPLAFMETQHRIILFDEPERSLFPDIQRTLIDYYVKLAHEAQFFFATHSPIIASQFEPCERFILSFDEETGFVKVRNGIAPEGDDPNDLLSKDFGMRTIMGEKGMAAWERFVELRMLIREEKNDTKKEQFANEYLSLQRAYNF